MSIHESLGGIQDKWVVDNKIFKRDRQSGNAYAEVLSTEFFRNLTPRPYYTPYFLSGPSECFSYNFLSPGEYFVPFKSIANQYPRGYFRSHRSGDASQDLWELSEALNPTNYTLTYDYLLMLVRIDLSIGNPDRHMGNFGIIAHSAYTRLPPVFDCGAAWGVVSECSLQGFPYKQPIRFPHDPRTYSQLVDLALSIPLHLDVDSFLSSVHRILPSGHRLWPYVERVLSCMTSGIS